MLQKCGIAPRISSLVKVVMASAFHSAGSAISTPIAWTDPTRMDAVSSFIQTFPHFDFSLLLLLLLLLWPS